MVRSIRDRAVEVTYFPLTWRVNPRSDQKEEHTEELEEQRWQHIGTYRRAWKVIDFLIVMLFLKYVYINPSLDNRKGRFE